VESIYGLNAIFWLEVNLTLAQNISVSEKMG